MILLIDKILLMILLQVLLILNRAINNKRMYRRIPELQEESEQTVEEVEVAFQMVEAVGQKQAWRYPSVVLFATNEKHVSIYQL